MLCCVGIVDFVVDVQYFVGVYVGFVNECVQMMCFVEQWNFVCEMVDVCVGVWVELVVYDCFGI